MSRALPRIKRCPKCGGMVHSYTSGPLSYVYFTVGCQVCDEWVHDPDERKAILLWNSGERPHAD